MKLDAAPKYIASICQGQSVILALLAVHKHVSMQLIRAALSEGNKAADMSPRTRRDCP